MRHYLIIISIFCFLSSESQTFTIVGKIKNIDKDPVENVNIRNKNETVGTVSDKYGKFELLKIKRNDTLIISHISYVSIEIPVKNLTSYNDTIFLTIGLDYSSQILSNVYVNSAIKAEVVSQMSIDDFEFVGDKIMLLGHNINGFFIELNQKRTYLNKNTNEVKFTSDVFDGFHVLATDSVYQLSLEKETPEIIFTSNMSDYVEKLFPYKFIINNKLIVEDIEARNEKFNQERVYFSIDLNNKEKKLLKKIFNEAAYKYAESYYKSILNLYNRETPITQNQIINGTWTGSVNSLLTTNHLVASEIDWFNNIASKPIYAPIVKHHNMVSIIDFSNNKIYNFNSDLEPVKSVKIDSSEYRKFDANILFDRVSNLIYLTTKTASERTLLLLNPESGKLSKKLSIPHLFPKNIKVHNGYVYYVILSDKDIFSEILYRIKI